MPQTPTPIPPKLQASATTTIGSETPQIARPLLSRPLVITTQPPTTAMRSRTRRTRRLDAATQAMAIASSGCRMIPSPGSPSSPTSLTLINYMVNMQQPLRASRSTSMRYSRRPITPTPWFKTSSTCNSSSRPLSPPSLSTT